MNQIIEVIYENNVFKPLTPVKELKKNEKAWIILCPSWKKGLNQLIGTLTAEEADEMQQSIDREFSNVEGEW